MHTHVALQREGGQMMFLRATSIPVRAKNVDGRTMAVSTTRYTAAAAQNVRSHYFFACISGMPWAHNYAAQRN